MSVSGFDIKVRLEGLKQKGIPATQRWMLAHLQEMGYTITEPMLSDIIRERYRYKIKDEILDSCDQILSAFEVETEDRFNDQTKDKIKDEFEEGA